jgi:hypothetical protein
MFPDQPASENAMPIRSFKFRRKGSAYTVLPIPLSRMLMPSGQHQKVFNTAIEDSGKVGIRAHAETEKTGYK